MYGENRPSCWQTGSTTLQMDKGWTMTKYFQSSNIVIHSGTCDTLESTSPSDIMGFWISQNPGSPLLSRPGENRTRTLTRSAEDLGWTSAIIKGCNQSSNRFCARRFSEPTFRPSGATNHWKNWVNCDFPTFSRTCLFFLLTLSPHCSSHCFSSPLWLFPPLLFHLSILSEVWLLNFLRWILFYRNSSYYVCGEARQTDREREREDHYRLHENISCHISAKFTLNSKRFPRLKSTFPLWLHLQSSPR